MLNLSQINLVYSKDCHMQVINKQYSIIFVIFFGLWVSYLQLSTSRYIHLIQNTDSYYALFNYSFFFIFIICILFLYKITKKVWFDLLIVSSFTVLLIVTKQTGFLVNFCLVFILCKYVEFKRLLTTFLIGSLISLVIIYLGEIFELYSELNNISFLFREDGTERHLMGFTFPTLLPNYFFHIVLCYSIVRGEKLSIIELLFIMCCNIYLFHMTDTKAIFYLISLFCFLLFVNKILRVNYCSKYGVGYVLKFGTVSSFIICFFVAVYVQCTFNPEVDWMKELDKVLAGRLRLGNQGFNEYGIHLWGAHVEYIGYFSVTEKLEYFFIDSAFQRLLINYGLIVSLLLAVGFTKLSYLVVQKNNVVFGLALIFLMFHSLTDPQLIDPAYNPIFFALAYLASKDSRDKLFQGLK